MSTKSRRIVKRTSKNEKCSYLDSMLEVDVKNIAFNVAADHYKLNIGTVGCRCLVIVFLGFLYY